MNIEVVKPIIKVGNSAGVLVPKEWINGSARVELITKPLDIKRDILEILNLYLEDIIGVYLVGSYARDEQTDKSDVDVLVITGGLSNRIKKGRYDMLLIKKEEIDNALENEAIPLIPMIMEAKPVIGKKLIEDYKKEAKLSRKNLRWYLDITRSAIKLNEASINVSKEKSSEKCGDAVSYSLILNLRSTYIIDCIRNSKRWTTKGILSIIKRTAGSLEAYNGYLRVKNDEKTKETLPIGEAGKLIDYISKRLKEHEKWLKARKK